MISNSINKTKQVMPLKQSNKTLQLSQESAIKRINNFENFLKNSTFQPEATIANNNCKVISSIYKPVICYLRLIGACPLYIKETDTEIVYTFKLVSGISIANAIVSCIIILFYLHWVVGLTHVQHLIHDIGIKNGNNSADDVAQSSGCKSLLTPFLKQALPMQLPINTSINIIATLTSIPKLAKLLDTWSQFEKKFQKKLNSTESPYVALNRTRNQLAICYLAFTGVYCALVTFVTKPCIPKTIIVCSWWRQLVGGVVVLPYAMYTFMEDFKFLFMFRTLEAGFMQVIILIIISKKIKQHNLQESQLPGILLPDMVEKWQDLLHDLREQTRLSSSCSSFHHVVSISTTFFSLLVGVYFSIIFQFTSAIDKEKSGIAFAALGFCAVGFSRCLIKTNGSERVLNAEKRAVDQLSVVKTGDDFMTQIKINALVDLIGRDPAQIKILNSFKLNTSFLFQIIGQIATYLIVFLQFDKL